VATRKKEAQRIAAAHQQELARPVGLYVRYVWPDGTTTFHPLPGTGGQATQVGAEGVTMPAGQKASPEIPPRRDEGDEVLEVEELRVALAAALTRVEYWQLRYRDLAAIAGDAARRLVEDIEARGKYGNPNARHRRRDEFEKLYAERAERLAGHSNKRAAALVLSTMRESDAKERADRKRTGAAPLEIDAPPSERAARGWVAELRAVKPVKVGKPGR